MLIILFGYPASGKNFVGEIMKDDFNFFFYDGDNDLTPEIKKLVKQGRIVREKLRDDYFRKLIKKLEKLQRKYTNIVFSQAFTKEKHRKLFAKHFPNAKFLFIETPTDIICQRLKDRKHLIDEAYAKKIMSYYETPKITHQIITNDSKKKEIKIQLRKILNIK